MNNTNPGSNIVNNTSIIEVHRVPDGTTYPQSQKITDYSKYQKVTNYTRTNYAEEVKLNLGYISDVYIIRGISKVDPNSPYDINHMVSSNVTYYNGGYYSGGSTHTLNFVENVQDSSGGGETAITYKSGNYVWLDTNKDGIQNEVNTGIADVLVTITFSEGTQKSVRTDTSGYYEFNGLNDKETYTISFTPPPNYVSAVAGKGAIATDSNSLTTTFTINAVDNMTIDTGFYLNQIISDSINDSISDSLSDFIMPGLELYDLGDKVWYDEDQDCI